MFTSPPPEEEEEEEEEDISEHFESEDYPAGLTSEEHSSGVLLSMFNRVKSMFSRGLAAVSPQQLSLLDQAKKYHEPELKTSHIRPGMEGLRDRSASYAMEKEKTSQKSKLLSQDDLKIRLQRARRKGRSRKELELQ